MIPKIIHWCWLSNDPLPKLLEACIQSWKEHLPDYEIKLWNMSNFDVNSVPYVSDAVKARKWAFACDYIRAYALYTEGGIYMDSDIFVRKNFDFVLNNRAFSAMEVYPESLQKSIEEGIVDSLGNKNPDARYVLGCNIQAAILGAEKGHPFFRDILNYYNNHRFIREDGRLDTDIIAPCIYANIATKYGYRFVNEEQLLKDDFRLYSSEKFAPLINMATSNSYAVHCAFHSWAETNIKLNYLQKIKLYFAKIRNKILHRDSATGLEPIVYLNNL